MELALSPALMISDTGPASIAWKQTKCAFQMNGQETLSHSKPFRNHRYDLWTGPSRLSKINSRKCWSSPSTCPRYTFPGSPWETWVALTPNFLWFSMLMSLLFIAESPPQVWFGSDKEGWNCLFSPIPNETNWWEAVYQNYIFGYWGTEMRKYAKCLLTLS